MTTLAGDGIAGSKDGRFNDGPRFSSPAGIAVFQNVSISNTSTVVYVADTGNHRIRKVSFHIDIDDRLKHRRWINITVECYAGLCTDLSPTAGYSDGPRAIARFNSPRGVAVNSDGDLFITDTNNHLIRQISRTGQVKTIAGSVKVAEVCSCYTIHCLIICVQ